MSNKDYLEKIRKAREEMMYDYNMTCNDLAGSSEFDLTRIATALEIIAENLMTLNDKLEKISPYVECIPASINRR